MTKSVTCDDCGTDYPAEDGYCIYCDETTPPKGSQCEYCENPATAYAQDNPVCDDHFEDAYPID